MTFSPEFIVRRADAPRKLSKKAAARARAEARADEGRAMKVSLPSAPWEAAPAARMAPAAADDGRVDPFAAVLDHLNDDPASAIEITKRMRDSGLLVQSDTVNRILRHLIRSNGTLSVDVAPGTGGRMLWSRRAKQDRFNE